MGVWSASGWFMKSQLPTACNLSNAHRQGHEILCYRYGKEPQGTLLELLRPLYIHRIVHLAVLSMSYLRVPGFLGTQMAADPTTPNL